MKTVPATYQMIETSPCYRLQNVIEFEIFSEKNYETNIESFNIIVGLRPLILFIFSYNDLTPLKAFFDEALPKSAPDKETPSNPEEKKESPSAKQDLSGSTQKLVNSIKIKQSKFKFSFVNFSQFVEYDGVTVNMPLYKM